MIYEKVDLDNYNLLINNDKINLKIKDLRIQYDFKKINLTKISYYLETLIIQNQFVNLTDIDLTKFPNLKCLDLNLEIYYIKNYSYYMYSKLDKIFIKI